jgi:hypothetical protein
MSAVTDNDLPPSREDSCSDPPAEKPLADAENASLDRLLDESLMHLEHQVGITKDFLVRFEPNVPTPRPG